MFIHASPTFRSDPKIFEILRPGRAQGADEIADFQLIWVFYANLSTLCSKFCAALFRIERKCLSGSNPLFRFFIESTVYRRNSI